MLLDLRLAWPAQLLLLLVAKLAVASALVPHNYDEVPHVSLCNYCQECLCKGLMKSTQSLQDLEPSSASPGTQTQPGDWQALFEPNQYSLQRKQHLPNCTKCCGCNTKLLSFTGGITVFGRQFHNRVGLSRAWVYKATSSRDLDEPDAVVKLLCVPLDKKDPSRTQSCTTRLSSAGRVIRMLRAVELISQECGFKDVVVKSWAAKVNAVLPDLGFHVHWHGLWMNLVKGASIPGLVLSGQPATLESELVADFLTYKLNGTQVLLAAIFDLLTSQCDRHPFNVLLTEEGQVQLIDNDVVLQDRWRDCGLFSVFLPITQRDWNTEPTRQDTVTPLCVLDYRCHLPDGKDELGTAYPSQVSQCLARISSMTVDEVQDHYDIDRLPARNLHNRATDMLTKGFEWAMRYGEPQNAPEQRFDHPHKCCAIRWSQDTKQYHCIRD